ncbi:MAG: ORF6N domain-containing protein [Bacteroidales bacterium]
MLDKDLAELYGVSTSYLNKSVKRNITRFPEDFMFQLSEVEFKNLMFQFGTSNRGGTRKMPFCFTEQGIAMLSSILNSERASKVNIRIIRIFIRMRELINNIKTNIICLTVLI